MLDHNSARRRARKVKRRPLCSRCGNFGHYAKRCKIQESVILKSKMDKNKAKPVAISFLSGADLSPHVIRFDQERDKDRQQRAKIKVFSEQSNKTPRVEVVDFAAGIKEANSRMAYEVQKPMVVRCDPAKIRVGSRPGKEKSIKKENSATLKKQADFNKIFSRIKNYVQRAGDDLNWKKMAYATVTASLLLSVPFPAIGYYQKIKGTNGALAQQSTNGFLALQSSTKAAFSANFVEAESELQKALQSFGAANAIADKEYGVLLSVSKFLPIIGKEVSGRQRLLKAGQYLAMGNTYLLKGIDEAKENARPDLTNKIEIVKTHLIGALPQYEKALTELCAVDPKVVPVKYSKSFSDFKLLFAALVNDMKEVVNLTEATNLLLGSESLKRYLVVFQNNNELRPTGGFLGSFAVVDVQKGRLLNIEVPGGGSYDLRGQLTHFVKPPLPLQMVNGRWEFQDANWFPDFSLSAKKMEWFYENSRGRTVDGVIAVNGSVLERVIGVIGTLKSGEKQIELTRADAIVKLQKAVELDYDKTINKPKEVIGELLDEVVRNLGKLDAKELLRLLVNLNEAANKKEIQIYSNDGKVQDELRRFGWTGEVLPNTSEQDYLWVVAANLQGQKSDAKIEQKITHNVEVLADGSVIDTVRVSRKHNGVPGELFYGATNVSYLRFYVPDGSELTEAGGFVYPTDEAFHAPESWYEKDTDLEAMDEERQVDVKTGTRVTSEFGKTVFGNWMVVEPGKSAEVYVKYKLPFKVLAPSLGKEAASGLKVASILKERREHSKYDLILQKQSGLESVYSFNFKYPDGWLPIWQSDEKMGATGNMVSFDGALVNDGFYRVLIARE